jgi:YHS domain-containing protein
MPQLHQLKRGGDAPLETHIDPVCGMTVLPERSAGSFDHAGKTYYFCGKSCLARFSAAPETYLNSVPNGMPAEEDTGDYTPLIVVILMIASATAALAIRDSVFGSFDLRNTVSYFMTGFLLVFAGFKLVDIRGFAEGYSTYDLLAQRVYAYGYVYPFIELGFGLAMLAGLESRGLFIAEFLVMTFSGIGVAIKLIRKEAFQCACLGTFLKVPLTKVTIIEDFGMAALALFMLTNG